MISSLKTLRWFLPALALVLTLGPSLSAAEIFEAIPRGATWKFLDDGSDQGTAWRASAFDDSGWASGPAQLGYGDGDETTVVSFGPNSGSKYITTYFRHSFNVPDDLGFTSATINLVRDDGAVIYLNGVEVYRVNIPDGNVSFDTLAAPPVEGADESTFFPTALNPAAFLPGQNVIAVEIHQWAGGSSDISFDLELTAEFDAPPNTPPSILAEPEPLSVEVGESATFSVTVFGSRPLEFQWRKDGTPIGGATGASLIIPSVTLNDAGSYDVQVSNDFGSTNSAAAVLDVFFNPPTIDSQPSPLTVGIGESATFSVRASGSAPLQYQWRFNGVPIPGANGNDYTIVTTAFEDSGNYQVEVSNAFGSVTSVTALLDVVFLNQAQRTYEPIGPSSRRTGLVFSEIMYHPKDRTDGRNLEFIEIYNTNPFFEDLSGYRISAEVDYTFPPGTILEGQSYLVVAGSPSDVEAVYGLSGVQGPWSTNKLSNSSGRIRLRKKSDAIVLEVNYSDQPPWPTAADGAGHSLILARGSYGEDSPEAWEASAAVGGSPGTADPLPTGPLEHVTINEILAHTDLPAVDFIELFNNSPLSVDLSGCFLSDDRDLGLFQIPNGTLLGPGEAIAFDETQLGFALSADGETVYFLNPTQSRVVDALRFKGQANGVSYGRYPDGQRRFQFLSTPTPAQANAAPLTSDIVINEIMYNPISGDSDDEYVELHNRGTGPVDVSGWKFIDGIDFAIPANTTIPAGGYLVVARNAARLLAHHPGLSAGLVLGDFGGQLSNRGERLALARPDTLLEQVEPGGAFVTNLFFIVVDEVSYQDGGRWGQWSDGGGSSLELIDPSSDNDLAPNWADSDESAKSEWVTVEKTDVMNLNHPAVGSIDQLHFFLLDKGEALVDDVVFNYNGGNRVSNPGFQSGLTGWFFQGTQRPSFLETSEGFNSSQSLHLVARARGGVANRVRTQLTQAPPVNSMATIQAKVRWLRGHREIVFRAVGSSIEAVATLPVPTHLGTPGAANSRRVANAGPAITDVTHRPAVPQPGQDIQVTARIHDADGLTQVLLRYRIDPSPTLVSLIMTDDGTGADLRPNDGVFTGVIPSRSAGELVAFRVQARDDAVPAAITLFPNDAPARECLVRIGDAIPTSDFGTYRFWITQDTFNFWSSRENSSNEDVDTTFVYGDTRVFYNVGAHYGASDNYSTILNTPTGTAVGYNLEFSSDERLLGARGVRLDWAVRDPTVQREHLMYWILEQYGLPNNHRRFINFYINGVRRRGGNGNLYEDTQRPNGDMLESWYNNDAEGQLFKTDGWFEASPQGVFNPSVWLRPLMQIFNDATGNKKLAYYRFNWKPRNTDLTANDYSNIFDMIDSANINGPAYVSTVNQVIDMENWMRTFAMNDLASFWDSFGNPNSKNAYIYKPERSGWKILSWDFDVGLGVFNDPPNYPLFAGGVDPVIVRMNSTPEFVRHYWRAIDEAVNTFFNAGSVTRFLSERYDAFQANGVGAVSPFSPSGPYNLSIPDWITQRRDFLITQLNTVAASFAVNGPTQISTSENLLVLSGTAPVRVDTVSVNGLTYPVTWTAITSWSLQVPLEPGMNTLNIQGLDRLGNPLAGTARTITAEFTGAGVAPEDHLVITEIQYNPVIPAAEFVEIHNTSTVFSFDLTGWRLNGVDYDFSPGTIITNGQYLVLAKNRKAFALLYGIEVPVFDEFDGSLDNEGETLTLLRPGLLPGEEIVVDRVTYDDQLPWPAVAGTDLSLQLIDAAQDNSRVGNWTAGVLGEGWKEFSITQALPAASSVLRFNLGMAGEVLIDNVEIVEGSVPGVGPNLVPNGDFESGVRSPWLPAGNHITTDVTTDNAYEGSYSLKIVATGTGSSANLVAVSVPGMVVDTEYTFSFKYLSVGPNRLRWRVSAFFEDFNVGIDVTPIPPIPATPGMANSLTQTLPPFDPVWLNEVMPNNTTTLADNFGEFDPWIELLNDGGVFANLEGYFLANNVSTNLTQWAFPAGSEINPSAYQLVWADGQTGQSTVAAPHANFTLNSSTGVVALVRMVNGAPQITDYLRYSDVVPDHSFGAYPQGQTSFRQEFFFPTPGTLNDPSRPPVSLFINEWMASNSGIVLDPADQDADDWFELYNPNSMPVDLSGYRLSDRLDDPNKFVIPAGVIIPAQGFLLIWADEEGAQFNLTGQVHASFKLGGGGEAIHLFAPDGSLIDSVVFGPQASNVSQGRFPDGAMAPFSNLTTPTPGAPNVLAPPEVIITNVNLDAGGLNLTWSAQAGRTYRVQFKNSLGDAAWQDLAGDVVATGSTASKTDPGALGQPQRFYQVLLLP